MIAVKASVAEVACCAEIGLRSKEIVLWYSYSIAGIDIDESGKC